MELIPGGPSPFLARKPPCLAIMDTASSIVGFALFTNFEDNFHAEIWTILISSLESTLLAANSGFNRPKRLSSHLHIGFHSS